VNARAIGCDPIAGFGGNINTKSEARNPKQYQRTKIQMTETNASFDGYFLVLKIGTFGFRACFEFRPAPA
jgi:hypothetical protein